MICRTNIININNFNHQKVKRFLSSKSYSHLKIPLYANRHPATYFPCINVPVQCSSVQFKYWVICSLNSPSTFGLIDIDCQRSKCIPEKLWNSHIIRSILRNANYLEKVLCQTTTVYSKLY